MGKGGKALLFGVEVSSNHDQKEEQETNNTLLKFVGREWKTYMKTYSKFEVWVYTLIHSPWCSYLDIFFLSMF